jgi:hypothetical protein
MMNSGKFNECDYADTVTSYADRCLCCIPWSYVLLGMPSVSELHAQLQKSAEQPTAVPPPTAFRASVIPSANKKMKLDTHTAQLKFIGQSLADNSLPAISEFDRYLSIPRPLLLML